LESELFGHEKGAFTNAFAAKRGLVEVANGGTLFLDEVGDISPMTQPKLLRFLETGEFRRVGGTTPLKVDVRVVSATNKNLQDEVQAGRFREDLLYRLNVVTIRIPPLKDRKGDIPALVDFFLKRKSKSRVQYVSPEAMQTLVRYDWPGNVRELEHVIEGAMVLCQSDTIVPKDLWVNAALKSESEAPPTPAPAPSQNGAPSGAEPNFSLEEIEKQHIMRALQHYQWNRVKASRALGITPKTLYLKIKKYGLKERA
jgi:DNA-binding NtrC family response regulator